MKKTTIVIHDFKEVSPALSSDEQKAIKGGVIGTDEIVEV